MYTILSVQAYNQIKTTSSSLFAFPLWKLLSYLLHFRADVFLDYTYATQILRNYNYGARLYILSDLKGY